MEIFNLKTINNAQLECFNKYKKQRYSQKNSVKVLLVIWRVCSLNELNLFVF